MRFKYTFYPWGDVIITHNECAVLGVINCTQKVFKFVYHYHPLLESYNSILLKRQIYASQKGSDEKIVLVLFASLVLF